MYRRSALKAAVCNVFFPPQKDKKKLKIEKKIRLKKKVSFSGKKSFGSNIDTDIGPWFLFLMPKPSLKSHNLRSFSTIIMHTLVH